MTTENLSPDQVVRELRHRKNMQLNSPELCERAADHLESQSATIAAVRRWANQIPEAGPIRAVLAGVKR